MSRTHISVTEWRRIVQERQASGQTVAAFCRRARIPESSFYAWQRRLRKATGFVKVKLPSNDLPRVGPQAETKRPPTPTIDSAASAIELHLPGDRCVVVRPGFDRRTLQDLLAVLHSIPSQTTQAELSA